MEPEKKIEELENKLREERELSNELAKALREEIEPTKGHTTAFFRRINVHDVLKKYEKSRKL